jgi:predicted RNase H-like HicB family nuclease/uncharacterized protein (DUF1778 family)
MNYIAYLHKDPKSDYGVSFPDFPGCITAGKTLQEAQQMAEEALALHIKGMIEDGEDLPEPSTLDALADDPARENALPILVHVEPVEKTVRINITAREKQIEEIDRLANEAGMTRSAYMVRASLAGGFQAFKSAKTKLVDAREAKAFLEYLKRKAPQPAMARAAKKVTVLSPKGRSHKPSGG